MNDFVASRRPVGPSGTAGNGLQKEVLRKAIEFRGGIGAATNYALAFNPSRRLSCSIEVFFETVQNLTAAQLVSVYNATWNLKAMAKGAARHGSAPLHDVVSSANGNSVVELALPHSYELDTAIRVLQIATVATGGPTTIGGSTLGLGFWWIRGRWEPNQAIEPSELASLFGLCDIACETVFVE